LKPFPAIHYKNFQKTTIFVSNKKSFKSRFFISTKISSFYKNCFSLLSGLKSSDNL